MFMRSTEVSTLLHNPFRETHGAEHKFDGFEIRGDRVADKTDEGLAAHSIIL